MQGKNLVETVIGGLVLAIAGLFALFAYDTADVSPVEGYEVTAKFNKIDGIQTGSDIRLAGVKVGTVSDQVLDHENYLAVLHFNLDAELQLPVDSTASITSDGLLGSKYVRIEPGVEKTMIASGGEITNTVDGAAIEDLIGRMIFLATEN